MPTLDDLDDVQIRRAANVLERENRKLIHKNAKLESRVRELEGKQPTQLELRIAELERQLAERNRLLFGDKTERRQRTDREGHAAADKRGHGPQSQPELPIVEEQHQLDEADQACPSCGGTLEPWDGQSEDSDEVDVIERRFVIVRRRRQKYRCKCGSCVETAPGPARLIPGGRYSARFATAVAIAKYADHLPLERQVAMMRRQGLTITSQTLWDQIEALATRLAPAYERLGEYIRSHAVLGADETPWKMLRARNKAKRKRWYAWALAAPDAVIYRIDSSRSAEAAARALGDFRGTLVCDGYTAYETLRKQRAGLRLAHCWAHARRKFWEIEPLYPDKCGPILELIGQLYGIEAETKDLDPQQRLDERRARAGPVVKQIHEQVLSTEALPESALGKAIKYLGGIWEGLQVFLDDPEVSLDNNAVERALRAVVLGRKNHYGSKSRRGTEVAALFYSLIESAKLAGLMPDDYLDRALDDALHERPIPLPHELVADA